LALIIYLQLRPPKKIFGTADHAALQTAAMVVSPDTKHKLSTLRIYTHN
jgi:hypothetical protein